MAGYCVLWVGKCVWMFCAEIEDVCLDILCCVFVIVTILCAECEEEWLDSVCCGWGSVSGCCVLRLRMCAWIFCAVFL